MAAPTARPGADVSRKLDAIILHKSSAPLFELLLLGILAGVYIGFGAVAATTVLAYGDPSDAVTKFLAASAFCVGLVLVVIPGSELFTGNILMTAGIAGRKVGVGRVLRNWVVVYCGNFLGALMLSAIVYASGLTDPAGPVGQMAAKIATSKIALPVGQALARGVLCNMLVCLAVIIVIASKTTTGKVVGLYFPIMVFVLSGFEHSIANMYFLPAGLLARGALWGEFWSMFHNLVPVTIGNIAGGMLVVLLHPARAKALTRRFSQVPPAGA